MTNISGSTVVAVAVAQMAVIGAALLLLDRFVRLGQVL